MKTIGVLTSGGDAPGMNAAVVRTACENHIKVYGIDRGYKGLMEGSLIPMEIRTVCDIIHRGGTMLHSARSKEFATEEGMQKAIEICHAYGIEGIVVIGGDGSFRGARDLSEIGIPGTIDNDIACCDYTIGYDTCLNTIMEMVDRIRDTSASHDRCSVIEVMGRRAGYLALNAGIAVGATAILIPEIEFDLKRDVFDRIRRTQKTGKKHFLVIVAEGVTADGNITVDELAKAIEEETGVESRAMVLAHVQRGGSPTVRDRVVASQMGYRAVELLMDGIGNRVVAMQKDQIVDYDIFEALNMKKHIDMDLYKMANIISI